MKSLLKALLILVALLLVGATSFIVYITTALPQVGAPTQLVVDTDSATLARGKYLAENVCVCIDCHSTRDWSSFSGPLVLGTFGKGGELFDQNFGFPGKFTSKNITPYHLSTWTDGEIYRAITCGVSKDGNALFPVMPYANYGKMDPADVESIVAYLRSLNSLAYEAEESKPDFPMNIILHTIPQTAKPTPRPLASDTLAYGAYLVNAAACGDYHTPQDKGAKLPGMDFAGRFEFPLPQGTVRSPNITPHPTGLGTMTKAEFVQKFKRFAQPGYVPHKVGERDFQTVMPWTMYAGMTVPDLEAIYAYLHTLTPIDHKVTRFTPTANKGA